MDIMFARTKVSMKAPFMHLYGDSIGERKESGVELIAKIDEPSRETAST